MTTIEQDMAEVTDRLSWNANDEVLLVQGLIRGMEGIAHYQVTRDSMSRTTIQSVMEPHSLSVYRLVHPSKGELWARFDQYTILRPFIDAEGKLNTPEKPNQDFSGSH
jgi:hypothetical protein